MNGDRFILTLYNNGEEYITDTEDMPKMLVSYDDEEIKEHYVNHALTRRETCRLLNQYERDIDLLNMLLKAKETHNPFQREVIERLKVRLMQDRNYLVRCNLSNYCFRDFDMREYTTCYDTNFLTFISDKCDNLEIINLEELASIEIIPILADSVEGLMRS